MAVVRIKIITSVVSNVLHKPDENISVSDSIRIFKSESVCDYNILIVDLRTVQSFEIMWLDRSDFVEFLGKPSLIMCIADEEKLYTPPEQDKQKWVLSFSNYGWLPDNDKFKVINKKGESLEPTKNSGRFSKLFKEYNWEWQCSFSTIGSTSQSYVSIANNITGQSVALRGDIEEGRVIIIPTPKMNIAGTKEYAMFFRLLIDLSKEEIEELTNRERVEPDWVEKYVVPEEIELRHKIKELQNQCQPLTKAHKLFYETGKVLTKTINFVMHEMGFNAQMKEEEGTHDIEICEGDCNLVLEITSSEENWINIYKTRQLSDWCQRFERDRGIKPKGILIANHFCNHPPPERDIPFTGEALKQGKSEGFCLMTTVQLYKMFCKFLKGEMSKDDIKQLFSDTQGLLEFEG